MKEKIIINNNDTRFFQKKKNDDNIEHFIKVVLYKRLHPNLQAQILIYLFIFSETRV